MESVENIGSMHPESEDVHMDHLENHSVHYTLTWWLSFKNQNDLHVLPTLQEWCISFTNYNGIEKLFIFLFLISDFQI